MAELRRLRALLTDTGRNPAVPDELSERLAAIGSDGRGGLDDLHNLDDLYAPGARARRRALTVSAAGVAILLALVTGVGYLAAPAERAAVADPSPAVRADFSATLAQLPLATDGVAAALLVDPARLSSTDARIPGEPTMAGSELSGRAVIAALQRADRAGDRVAFSGVQRVLAPRDDLTTAAEVEVTAEPGSGSQVTVRNAVGDQVAQGLVPDRNRSRVADADLVDALAANYRLSGVSGGTLLGRPVTLVEAHRRDGGSDRPTARWWLDDRTGLVLRQQTFDHTGRLVLSAGFTELSVGRATASGPNTHTGPVFTVMSRPLTTAAFTTASAPHLSNQGWFCRSELAGLSLVRLRADAPAEPGVLQMVYTDGLSTVSVFQRRGVLGRTPAEARWDPNLRAFRQDAMLNTAIWQSGDAVFTVATNGSPALRDKVVAAMPRSAADRRPGERPATRTTMERIEAGWTRILDRVR